MLRLGSGFAGVLGCAGVDRQLEMGWIMLWVCRCAIRHAGCTETIVSNKQELHADLQQATHAIASEHTGMIPVLCG